MSGKTTFVKRLLKHKDVMFTKPLKNVLFCFAVYQNAYDDIEKSDPDVTFKEGLPDSETMEDLKNGKYDALIIDDLMNEVLSSSTAVDLFTRYAHHYGLTVVYITQNIFCQGKHARTIALNCHYFVLFNNPRDESQIMCLGRQIFPGKAKAFLEIYKDATSEKYSYLLIDLHPGSDVVYKLRSRIFPEDGGTIVYRIKNL